MKKFTTSLLFLAICLTVFGQQTMWVSTGQVKYAFTTNRTGQMIYSAGGDTLTVMGKAFATSDIESIYVTSGQVDDNTIKVNYKGSNATVEVAGNIATKVTVNVNGADVSVLQDSTVTEELFYTLSGTSSNGSFYQNGDLKITLNLNGLNLTSTTGAALTIDDGKRVEINLLDNTVNSLVDAMGKTHKACMYINGHSEFKGGGTLNLTGNTKHAFGSDEYVELKKSFTGSIVVKGAEGDGFNINQSLEIKNGTLLVEQCEGDGIQIDAKKDTTKTNNGQFIMSGGHIQVLNNGDSSKGLKADDLMTISDGTLEINADDHAISSKGNIIITGGNIYAVSAAANGINATGTLTIEGGNIVAYGANSSFGINSSAGLYVNGGNLMAVGVANAYPHATSAQPSVIYLGKLPTLSSFALNNGAGDNALALTLTKSLSSTKTMSLMMSSPALKTEGLFTLYSGATLDTSKDNWHSFYTGGDAVISNGTAINDGGTSIATPYTIIR